MAADLDLDACYQAALEIAKQAGVVISEAFYKEKTVETKCSIADLVTETDRRVEQLAFDGFRERFPTHSFIGEESVSAGEKCNFTDNPTWIIDPIDGTNNFVHSFPYVAISIALTVKKKPVIGIVYNPIQNEMYTARLGQGAFLNGERINVTKATELGQSLICTEFGSSRVPAVMDAKFRCMRRVIEKAHGFRCMGSAALNMCYVAKGRVSGFFECGIHIWDHAAGAIIVTEAGGVVLDWSGGEFDMLARRVLCASSGSLGQEMAALLEDISLERD